MRSLMIFLSVERSGFGGIAECAGGDAELGEGFEVAPEG
jgi:hypothetical protein